MSQRRVLIVDYASEARKVSCGRDIAAALPHGPDVEIVRGTTDRNWARDDLPRCSHVILSGSDIASPRDEPWFEDACEQIRRVVEAGAPLLGICFGHQVITQALGDWDMAGPTGGGPEYGIVDLRPLGGAARDPVLGTFGPSGYSLYNAHFHEVYAARAVDALGLEVLAESERCAVHAYRLRGRPVWGIQSHPEITPEGMKACFSELSEHEDPETLAAAGISRDVDGRPSSRRPEVFDAFLKIEAGAASARDAAE